MDEYSYVKTRKGRLMAQTLEEFERLIEPHVPSEKAEEFKALFRRKLNSFDNEIREVLSMRHNGQRLNAHARSIQDGLFPDGRSRVVPPAETEEG